MGRVERLIDGKRLDCYAQEEEAFGNQSLFWFSLYGITGKSVPTHWPDSELNATTPCVNMEIRHWILEFTIRMARMRSFLMHLI